MNEWADIKQAEQKLQEQGYAPINKRRVRSLRLRFDGIVLSKKNRHIISKQGGIIPDAKARANQNEMVRQFVTQLKKQGIEDAFFMTKEEQVVQAKSKHTKYAILFEIWRGNDIRRDLDNQANTLLDAMVEAFAIADDSCKFIKEFTVRDMGVKKDEPHVEITIRIAEDIGRS